MDLPVPPHLSELRTRILRFVVDRVCPVEQVLERGFLDPDAQSLLNRLQSDAKTENLWALGLTTRLGGGGLPFTDYLYVNEIIGMSEYAMFVFGTHTLHDAMMLDSYASEEWRERYLKPLVDGTLPGPAFAMTERDVSGSDPTQIETTARLDNDTWVINGTKWFTTHAHSAPYTVVMARTETDGPRHEAFSMIIVPAETPGLRVIRTVATMGDVDGDHCEVEYDNVRVPEGNLLGPRGHGFRIAQDRLGPGRLFHCMRFLGQAERAFDLMCERAVRRVTQGSALADKQLVQKMVFDTATEIRAARLMALDAARALEAGEDARVEIGMAKVMGASVLHNAVDRAIQVHGSIGVSSDLPLARMYRNARYARLYDGPDETHIANVARQLLRSFRDPVLEAAP